jgi:type VI protein secretion system component VasF
MAGPHRAIVQTGAGGRPVLAADSLNLRDAEVALVRDAVKHAETLAAAAAMLGLSVPQLRSKARQLRVALPFTAREGRRS